ncbi:MULTISPECIES: ImmA/IrrE family metallo-endopeptidase [Paenibacillus]|uniref:ImmA/IrrE family metallo-endopeptidase n=1 Tax=Paenibacillus TaxID=44249 RepID=UPI00096E3563|nr:ImmA/IrrE family metallo-endopeptidase [Paenibacillus odorifer]OME16882.1 ImmA/IrrE family metallo-endopeptidase [Paenibacillus odorifer]
MDIVQKIIKIHGTNNPLKIAALLGIKIYYEDLGNNIWGYYVKLSRIPQIHINERLDDSLILFAVSHELGHHFLHPGINTPFLRKNTLYSVDKIEREAHSFAVSLLIGKEGPEIWETSYQFLNRCGIPELFHEFY